MPIYVYLCLDCGHREEIIRPVDRRDDKVVCSCGNIMNKAITAPVYKDFKPYYNEGLGEQIKSPAHFKEMLKKHDGLEPDYEANKTDGKPGRVYGQKTGDFTLDMGKK